ncbi:MAG: long-chain fatty acid--CoA ligase [Phycisphaerae bacterium]|nr:long-chain fatty acid--CoA ligase [Phycisphaerae bacterium]
MLVEALLESCERFPNRVACGDANRSLTYAQLVTFTRVIRRLVMRETTCERVGVMLPATPAAQGTIMGVLWAGRTVVPLNFLLPSRELAAVTADAGIDLVISTRHFEPQLSEVPVRSLYLEDLPLKRRYLFERLRRMPPPPRVTADDLAAIVYTSGSTGEPKGVCLSHGNFVSNCRAAIEHLRIVPDQHMLGVLPPFHVFGLTATTFIPLVLGGTVTYIPRFSPQAVAKVIEEERISIVMAIPSMYAAVARLKSVEPAQFASIRLAVSGGEPLPQRVFDEVRARLGLELLEGYGMTETSPIIAVNLPWANRVGTVGLPLPGIEWQVRHEQGRLAAANEEGELCVRGSLVMRGYFHRPAETAAVLDTDGWLHTGDIVRVEDGFIRITGRAKDMMIVGGENVFPREVEAILEQHPAVGEAVVIGQPDPTRGEVVVGFVVPRENATIDPEEIRAFCRKHLAGYKVPRVIHVESQLPRGPTGKILKRDLKLRSSE